MGIRPEAFRSATQGSRFDWLFQARNIGRSLLAVQRLERVSVRRRPGRIERMRESRWPNSTSTANSTTSNLPEDTPLLWVLRDELGLTGTKFGCGAALCGACTVHIDGQPGRACVTPISSLAGKKVVTIEAIGADKVGKAVQAAWIDLGVPQCGDRQAGQIMAATALLKQKSKTDRRRYRGGHDRQHLPLWHLRSHPRRHQAGRRRERSDDMNVPSIGLRYRRWIRHRTKLPWQSRNVRRRKFLQASALGGLVLAVGFPASVRAATRPSTAPMACRTAGSTARWCSSRSARTASSASSAIARRWARAYAPAADDRRRRARRRLVARPRRAGRRRRGGTAIRTPTARAACATASCPCASSARRRG